MTRDPNLLRYSYEAGTWLFWLGDLPDAVSCCPSCGGGLPTMEGAVKRVIESPPEGAWPSDVEGD